MLLAWFFSFLSLKVKISCNLFPYVPYLLFVYGFIVCVCTYLLLLWLLPLLLFSFFYSTLLHHFVHRPCSLSLSRSCSFTAWVIWVFINLGAFFICYSFFVVAFNLSKKTFYQTSFERFSTYTILAWISFFFIYLFFSSFITLQPVQHAWFVVFFLSCTCCYVQY